MGEKELGESLDFLKQHGIGEADVGIVLGTGLGKLVDDIEVQVELPYGKIPHFPVATVEFHSGKLIYGNLQGKKAIAMQGRFHYYEGYTMQQITFPIRVMERLGIQALCLSNAAGAMNLSFKKGELMLVTDHINLLPACLLADRENPLRGKNIEAWGGRFPDMGGAYSKKLNDKIRGIARSKGLRLHEGVYVAVAGPNLETPAEYRYLRKIGADAVGMSTVPEVIVANHMNLPCCAISVLTDECDPDNLEPVDIPDILEQAAKAEPGLVEITKELVGRFRP